MNYRNVSLLALFSLLKISSVFTSEVTSPLRLRVSTKLLETIMNKNDQRVFELLTDMDSGSLDVGNDLHLENVTYTFVPINVPLEEYDHHFSFDEATFIGVE
jgi:hypothetical protein